MGEIGEALGQRVEANEEESHGRQGKAERVQHPTGRHQGRAAEQAEAHSTGHRDGASRQVSPCSAGIQCVKASVHDSVEGHGTSAPTDHGG